MKFLSFLLLAVFAVGTDALKGKSRELQQDSCGNDIPGPVVSDDCEICSKCNKDGSFTSVTFKYIPAGQNSRYQDSSFATCMAAQYPAATTVTAAGQSFSVTSGSIFTLNFPAGKSKFDANTLFTFSNFNGCSIHLSCSAPIVAGDQIGPFEIQGKDNCGSGGDNCGFEDCLICDSDTKEFPNGNSRRPTSLTFIYRSAGQNSVYQPEDKASCRAGNYPGTVTITVEGQTITVVDGQQFTVQCDGNCPAELDFSFSSGVPDCFIHSSCSVPIIVGDVIGPFEVVGDDKVCFPCDKQCLEMDKTTYNCGDAMEITFDVSDATDELGVTGPVKGDWIGIYPCNNVYSDSTFFYGVVNKYVCDQFLGTDSAACQLLDLTYTDGTVVIDRLPSYGELGPYIWPVTAFINNGRASGSFKAVYMRNEAPSPPPFIPVCESECFEIVPDESSRICKTRQNANELPRAAGFCFPGDATVQVQGQGPVAMKELALGDKILTSSGRFEPIYSFGHKNADISHGFVKLSTKKASLELSMQHMVYLKNGDALPAGSVKVGDELEIVDGTFSPVVDVSIVDKQGAFAPFTESGTVVVNGIKASTFISFQESANLQIAGINTGVSFQLLAHVFEFPHRMWCLHLSSCPTETYTDEGISTWVDLPNTFFKFLFSNNSVVLTVVAAVTVLIARKTQLRKSA